MFATNVGYAAGSFVEAVVAADLNGDGAADLIAANNDICATVRVFLNNGDGTFAAAVKYPSGGDYPRSVATGDLNGDGKPDLAVACSTQVSVLMNAGDGTFGPAIPYLNGDPVGAVAVADLDGDGKLDLAASNTTGVRVLLNGGQGTFAPPVSIATRAAPSSLAAADLDGDGAVDLVTTGPSGLGTGRVGVLRNEGRATFSAPVEYDVGVNPVSVAVGDFDGDAKLDLAVANRAFNDAIKDQSVSVLLNRGGGLFGTATSYRAGLAPLGMAARDVNGDGQADLIVANGDTGKVTVLSSAAGKPLSMSIAYSAGRDPRSVALADVDGDGRSDVAVANGTGGTISVLLDSGRGLFGPAQYEVPGIVRSFTTGDVDADQQPDLIVLSSPVNDTLVSLFANDGTGMFGPAGVYPFPEQGVLVDRTNLNADGEPDLVVTLGPDDRVLRTLNRDGTWGPAIAYPDIWGGLAPQLGDVSGDGRADLLSMDATGGVNVALNDGTGVFGKPVIYPAAVGRGDAWTGGAGTVTWGDIGADGKNDLVVLHEGGASVLINQGGGAFGGAKFYALGGYPVAAAIGDLDGDGKGDLAVANSETGTVDVLVNRGDGTLGAPASYPVGNRPTDVAVGDLDGDGRAELVLSLAEDGDVKVLSNLGGAAFAPAESYAVGSGQLRLALTDLNGDRRLDLVAIVAGGVVVLLNAAR